MLQPVIATTSLIGTDRQSNSCMQRNQSEVAQVLDRHQVPKGGMHSLGGAGSPQHAGMSQQLPHRHAKNHARAGVGKLSLLLLVLDVGVVGAAAGAAAAGGGTAAGLLAAAGAA